MDQLRTAMCAPLLDIGPLFLQSSQTSGLIVQVQIHFFVTAFRIIFRQYHDFCYAYRDRFQISLLIFSE